MRVYDVNPRGPCIARTAQTVRERYAAGNIATRSTEDVAIAPFRAWLRAMTLTRLARPKRLKLQVPDVGTVSALLQVPRDARAYYVLAHGAGAGMTHRFMVTIADRLAARGIATLRYNFPYMERGSRRPDSPPVAHATVRAAVALAARRAPRLVLFAGGKSFGGRMSSQAQASVPIDGVRGLIFLGFPLHPPAKPSTERAAHLAAIKIPALFLQGTRDEFAELRRLKATTRKLGRRATLELIAAADHSFHVPAKSGRTDEDILDELADTIGQWIDRVIPRPRRK